MNKFIKYLIIALIILVSIGILAFIIIAFMNISVLGKLFGWF